MSESPLNDDFIVRSNSLAVSKEYQFGIDGYIDVDSDDETSDRQYHDNSSSNPTTPCSDCSRSSVGDLQLLPLAKDVKDCDSVKKCKPTAAVKSNLMNKLHIAHNSSIADYSCHGADVEGRGIDKGLFQFLFYTVFVFLFVFLFLFVCLCLCLCLFFFFFLFLTFSLSSSLMVV